MKPSLLVLFLVSYLSGNAQRFNTDSLYADALKRFILYTDSVDQSYDITYISSDTVFVDGSDWTQTLPLTIANKTIIILTRKNWRKNYRLLYNRGRYFPYLQLTEPRIKGDSLTFEIGAFRIFEGFDKYYFITSHPVHYRIYQNDTITPLPIESNPRYLNAQYTLEKPAFKGGSRTVKSFNILMEI